MHQNGKNPYNETLLFPLPFARSVRHQQSLSRRSLVLKSCKGCVATICCLGLQKAYLTIETIRISQTQKDGKIVSSLKNLELTLNMVSIYFGLHLDILPVYYYISKDLAP